MFPSLSLLLLLQTATFTIARSSSKQPPTLDAKSQIFNLLSGGVAGTISSTITCPLEVVKTQLQSSSAAITQSDNYLSNLSKMSGSPLGVAKQIYRQDGVSGFWRGLPPTLVGIIPSRATYFWAYETSKKLLAKTWVGDGTMNHIVSGSMAGITGNTLTNPIWMVKTRMQLLPGEGQLAYTGYSHAVKTIYKTEGVGGFYRGITASYWGCTEGCIQFVLYEKIKAQLLLKKNAKRRLNNLPPLEKLSNSGYFWTAAFAKCCATITTYPHEVARTRMREQSVSGVFKYTGMFQTLRVIAREEGRKGLYAGMGTHTARVVPNSALMFLSYELVNAWLVKENKKENKKNKHKKKKRN